MSMRPVVEARLHTPPFDYAANKTAAPLSTNIS